MKVEDKEFLVDFATLSEIGATPGGGVDRQAATLEDHATRAWLSNWFKEEEFEEKRDGIGNQFGLLNFIPGAPYVLLGSHLDSQPLAGKYDGAYGVLAAAHAAKRIVGKVRSGDLDPVYNIAVVNWFNEEGGRFPPSMMGSSVFTGKMSLEAALQVQDSTGVTVREALAAGNGIGDYSGPEVACFAEIHNEQGRILEKENITIGLVHSTWATTKYEIIVVGEQASTGASEIALRKDALYGAALVVVAAREVAEEFPPDKLRSSVSSAEILPNSPVVIAREVKMNLDLRSGDEAVLAAANASLEDRLRAIEKLANLQIRRRITHSWPLSPYQAAGVELSEASAKEVGLSYRKIMTIAGHDSTNMKDVTPTVMLFVPSGADGITHNEKEFTSEADCCAGVTMLTAVAARMVTGELAEKR